MLDVFGDLIAAHPTLLLGDLNTGPKLGEPYIRGGDVFGRLAQRGLVSAYHAHHRCAHGAETHATYFHASRGHTPWHIDYCFLSETLLPSLCSVEIGDDERWAKRSDHRPLTVTLAPRSSQQFSAGWCR